jgi:bis(5'-nucleosyl)-tetraphosphatase (symmetrical)
MTIYAVGDLQGCLQPLQTLLSHVKFNVDKDKLWIAGDMVNRGPESLKVLRYLYHLRDNLEVVLGNHDLHLLAVAAGHRKASPSDTLDEILTAKDRDTLLEWIRQQSLLHHDEQLGYTMVHAGIPPQWSLTDAIQYAKEVESVIQGNKINKYLKNMYGNVPDRWDDQLKGKERWRLITNYLTRMRFCTHTGKLELNTKAGVDSAPIGYLPWFEHEKRKTSEDKIIFGHWAALEGKADNKNIFAIDTGFVWGGQLTLMRLDDEKLFSTPNKNF